VARTSRCLAAMIQLTDDDAEVRAYNPNQSDEYSGTIGDVEVFVDDLLISATECKHRPINLDDVEHGLRKNIGGAEYIFVIADGFHGTQEKAIRDELLKQERLATCHLLRRNTNSNNT